jgi:hypothetical protein
VAIALPANALLVDLVPARVGLAGESGCDGSGQGELIKFIIHSGPLFPMIQWIPTIHPRYFLHDCFLATAPKVQGQTFVLFRFCLIH